MKRITALLAGSVVLLPALPAEADPSLCDTVVTTSVTLTSDLACDFTVSQGGRVDLDGYTVDGVLSVEGSGTRIADGSVGGIVVRDADLDVSDVEAEWLDPVRSSVSAVRVDVGSLSLSVSMLAGTLSFRDSHLQNVDVCEDCGSLSLSGSVVDSELFVRNGGDLWLDDNDLTSVIVEDASLAMDGNRVTGSVVVSKYSPATVTGNIVRRFDVYEPTATFRIEGNIAGQAVVDMAAEPAAAGTTGVFASNWFVGSPASGLLVTGPYAGRVRVTGNLAVGNREYGIDAQGVVDGGGNRASGNQLANGGVGEQCLGVDCAPK